MGLPPCPTCFLFFFSYLLSSSAFKKSPAWTVSWPGPHPTHPGSKRLPPGAPHLRSQIRAVQSSPPVYIQRPSSWKPTDAMFLLTPS